MFASIRKSGQVPFMLPAIHVPWWAYVVSGGIAFAGAVFILILGLILGGEPMGGFFALSALGLVFSGIGLYARPAKEGI